MFLEKHGVSVLKKLLKFLVNAVREKRAVEVGESRDVALICALLRNVEKDDFYPTRTIREWVLDEIESDEPPKWLTSSWIGRALRRIGVREKRKVRNRNEWRLSPELVRDIARRYIANLSLDEELRKKLRESFQIRGTSGTSGARGAPTVADVRGAIGTELARIAREKTRVGGFSREWLIERIIELAEESGLEITRERAEAVFASLEEDGFIYKPEGGEYLWVK